MILGKATISKRGNYWWACVKRVDQHGNKGEILKPHDTWKQAMQWSKQAVEQFNASIERLEALRDSREWPHNGRI